MFELVASGGFWDLSNLGGYESQLAEGDKGLLELDLTVPVSAGVAQTLEDQLKAAGVTGVSVTTASPKLRIYFTKGFPWLAMIAAIILGLVVLAVLIVGWRLYKDVFPTPPPWPVSAAIIIAVVIGAVLVARRVK